ncbi:aminotransferase class V-fold PLP-dependent enzyme [Mycobacterium fragae]|uniref:Aminotransferase class V n=1 Tax=Mycobacterium fragae TaxID=1260918 RepID=A0A1X1UZA3_9MYCO|nr:aminotransferase class V-fold PLP-dependent enzyme [Mycobacterium fragae]MCV7401672.1 aminotransferase class V-fold PLP-dependent enzyme [Mycobacterium fragae]ORV62107.1 aminotransferase class V [Mycobacterium fragae]
MSREAFGAEFIGAEGFLDTPTYGVPPRFVADALREGADCWEQGRLELSTFDEPMRASRRAYAAMNGVDEGHVVLGNSVSSLIGLVASSIPDRSRVATFHDEFTSVTFPFAAQAGRGVTITELPHGRLEDSAGDFDVVAASLVQSADGALLDVPSLRRAVAGSRTITVIDTSQALGWKNIELPWVDVAIAASYKWLLGPRGVAWMSLSKRMQDVLVPHGANPYAGQELWSSLYGLPLRLASGARRFDASPAWFSVLGAGISLPWVASLDRSAVEAHTVGLANRLRYELDLPPVDSAIVSIPAPHAADALRRAGIHASVRAGAVRVGFHLYNTEADLDRLLDALASV